ncbi:MAG: nuclear transport factor 2 family protein [Candidatus Magnetominusculus sp. LBB02]|nr:nuclear transport factor 2 family protein [Candidatus Magnetominusculus sp. LBB02]
MIKKLLYLFTVTLIVLVMSEPAMCGSGKPIGMDVFVKQVKKVLFDMNTAFLHGDIEGFFKYVAHDADVVAVDIMAGDYIIGYDEIMAHMKKAAAMKETYKCTLMDEQVHVSNDIRVAWTAQLSDCSVTIDGKTVSAKIRSTATFERRGGAWLLVQEHDSIGLPRANSGADKAD